MEEEFQDLKIEDYYDVNILLLGETGVGKSTFINSLANYLHHHDLEKALQHPLFHLIPCMFNITDDNYRPQRVVVGSDDNEYQLVGDSATQDVRTYVFPLGSGKTRLRLIDSPGMGDPRGVEQDDMNCENILSYIGNLHHLHAICLLFRPNDARITITFEYCVKQILSRLEKSAAKNIIFVFTNAKATHYKPGETIACLKKVVEDIKKQPPYVEIKVEDNVFCFDNEAFRFLAAAKQGITFGDATKAEYFKSWANSSKEAWCLIKYIIGDVGRDALIPHMVKSSKSVNEARRIINQLAQPLADISQLILENLHILDRRQKELQEDNLSLDKLRGKLYVPVINLKVIKLTQPTTVCCDPKCAEFLMIEGRKIWNYKQRCHDPCHLRNVPQEIIGAPQLRNCTAIDRITQTCIKCMCAQTVHMHIYYMTEKFDDRKIDTNIQEKITTSEKALSEAERIVRQIIQKRSELQREKEVIIDCTAKFASFLQKNAITPFNDAYRKYINYMIFREQSLGKDADQQTIQHFQNLLIKYDQIKSTFDKATVLSGSTGGVVEIEAKDVQSHLEKLYSLKHNGKKIRELYSTQKTSRKKEYQKTEYVHSSPVEQPEKKSEKPQTQSDVEGKVKKNKQEKMFKNYHQHGVHKNKMNLQNNQKKKFQNMNKKDNVTSVISNFGSKKQIKIEINETSNKPAKKNIPNQNNERGNTKLTVLNSHTITEQRNDPQSIRKQQGNNHRSSPLNNYHPPPYDYQPPTQTNQPFRDSRSSNDYNTDPHRYDNRPPHVNQPSHGYSTPYSYPPPRDNRPPYNYPPYDSYPPHNNHPSYDNRPPYVNPPRVGGGSPYENRPYDNRLPYENRPPYDNRAPYENRPPYDNRPPYENRPLYYSHLPHESYDGRPPYDRRTSNDNPTYNTPTQYDRRQFKDGYQDDSHPQGYQHLQGVPYTKSHYDNRPQDSRSLVNNPRGDEPAQQNRPPAYSIAINQRRPRRRRKNNDSGTDSFKSCDDSD